MRIYMLTSGLVIDYKKKNILIADFVAFVGEKVRVSV